MATENKLTPHLMTRMLELFNHRVVRISRDGYDEQSFEIHYDISIKSDTPSIINVSAFSGIVYLKIDSDSNQVDIFNSAINKIISSKFINQYDALLYSYHFISIIANGDKNNAMFVMTVLPTVFTILLTIYSELPDSTDPELANACKEILTRTQSICFDQNAIVTSRKKL